MYLTPHIAAVVLSSLLFVIFMTVFDVIKTWPDWVQFIAVCLPLLFLGLSLETIYYQPVVYVAVPVQHGHAHTVREQRQEEEERDIDMTMFDEG